MNNTAQVKKLFVGSKHGSYTWSTDVMDTCDAKFTHTHVHTHVHTHAHTHRQRCVCNALLFFNVRRWHVSSFWWMWHLEATNGQLMCHSNDRTHVGPCQMEMAGKTFITHITLISQNYASGDTDLLRVNVKGLYTFSFSMSCFHHPLSFCFCSRYSLLIHCLCCSINKILDRY